MPNANTSAHQGTALAKAALPARTGLSFYGLDSEALVRVFILDFGSTIRRVFRPVTALGLVSEITSLGSTGFRLRDYQESMYYVLYPGLPGSWKKGLGR